MERHRGRSLQNCSLFPAKRIIADEDRAELEELEKQRAEAEAELKRLTVVRASLENDVQRACYEAKRAEERFANVGGEHWQEHEARKARHRGTL